MNVRQKVTLIGWIWVGLGALSFVSGTGAFLITTLLGMPAIELPVRSPLIDFVWQHYRAGAAIEALLSPLVVYSGLMFLRRHSWARVVLEVLSAAMLAWFVFFVIFWFDVLTFITSRPGPQPFLIAVRILMSVMGVVSILPLASAFGLCIWTLSRPDVKAEFRNAHQSA